MLTSHQSYSWKHCSCSWTYRTRPTVHRASNFRTTWCQLYSCQINHKLSFSIDTKDDIILSARCCSFRNTPGPKQQLQHSRNWWKWTGRHYIVYLEVQIYRNLIFTYLEEISDLGQTIKWKTFLRNWLDTHPASFYENSIKNLPERWEMQNQRNYTEQKFIITYYSHHFHS